MKPVPHHEPDFRVCQFCGVKIKRKGARRGSALKWCPRCRKMRMNEASSRSRRCKRELARGEVTVKS